MKKERSSRPPEVEKKKNVQDLKWEGETGKKPSPREEERQLVRREGHTNPINGVTTGGFEK